MLKLKMKLILLPYMFEKLFRKNHADNPTLPAADLSELKDIHELSWTRALRVLMPDRIDNFPVPCQFGIDSGESSGCNIRPDNSIFVSYQGQIIDGFITKKQSMSFSLTGPWNSGLDKDPYNFYSKSFVKHIALHEATHGIVLTEQALRYTVDGEIDRSKLLKFFSRLKNEHLHWSEGLAEMTAITASLKTGSSEDKLYTAAALAKRIGYLRFYEKESDMSCSLESFTNAFPILKNYKNIMTTVISTIEAQDSIIRKNHLSFLKTNKTYTIGIAKVLYRLEKGATLNDLFNNPFESHL